MRRAAAAAALLLLAGAALAYTLVLDSKESPGADAVLGQASFTAVGAGSDSTQLNGPRDVAFDSSGVMYVADAGNDRVLVFLDLSDTVPDTVIGGALNGVGADRLNRPAGLAVRQGAETTVLFVSDASNQRVLAYLVRTNGASTVLADTVADYVFGQPTFDTNVILNDGGGGSNASAYGLSNPAGLHAAEEGSSIVLRVADRNANRVLSFEIPWTSLGSASIDTAADAVYGQPSFAATAAGTSETALASPADVFAAGGRLWVADAGNHRVVVESTGDATWDAVFGQPSFTASAAGFSDTALDSPRTVSVSPDGRTLAIADENNHRVVLHADTTGADTRADDAVGDSNLVVSAFETDDSRGLEFPDGLFFEAETRLWVADVGNHRALRFDGIAREAPPGLATQGAIAVTSSAPETAPVFAAAAESYVLVQISGGGTTSSPAASADSIGTGADYTLVVPLGDGEGRDTATIYLWTSLEMGAVYVGLRSDASALVPANLPAGLRGGTFSDFEALRATAILLEFAGDTGALLGTTATTADVSNLYSYTIVYDLGATTTARFASLGFDTSAGSPSFRYWIADSWTGTWEAQERVPVRIMAGGATMRLAVVGLGVDLPGALGGPGPGVTPLADGGACLFRRAGLSAPVLSALRAWRDRLLGTAAGRLASVLYYRLT